MAISVHKCHAQSDFLIVDGADFSRLTAQHILTLCHRQKGLGCDQLVILVIPILNPTQPTAVYSIKMAAPKLCLNAAYALKFNICPAPQPWTLFQGSRRVCQTHPRNPQQLVLSDFRQNYQSLT